MKVYCKCGALIPEARLRILPNVLTCVKCSDVQKVSGIQVIHHKTGNEVQVIHNPETAAHLRKLSSRKTYGAVKTLLSKGSVQSTYSPVKVTHDNNNPKRMQEILERALSMINVYEYERIYKFVNSFTSENLITKETETVILTQVKERGFPHLLAQAQPKKKQYKQETVTEQVSDDVMDCFRNWKR